MIQINLINSKHRSMINPQLTTIAVSSDQVMTREELQKLAIARVLLMLTFPLLFYMYDVYVYQPEMEASFPPKQAEINRLIQFNSEKEKFVSDIKQFEKEANLIKDKINKIKFLNAIKGFEIDIHKFFQKNLPEKIWFDEFVYSFSERTADGIKGEIKIRGFSYNTIDIQQLRKAILESILFTRCDTGPSRLVKLGETQVEAFELIVGIEKKLEGQQ